jgi:RNA polymerase sigma-70 factor (ECF subfamily)
MRIGRESFEHLVREHHAAVFRSARRILRDEATAEDVTQQVFLRVLDGRCAPPTEPTEAARVLRWLATRLALNELRAGQRRRHHETETAKMQPTQHEQPPPTDELRAVRAAIDGLDDPLRTAVVLRYQEGMTLAAVAASVGCAESTVHERLRQALVALRRQLAGLGLAAAGARIELLLPQSAAPIMVPGGLQAKLLALTPTLVGLAAGKAALAVGLLLAVGAAVFVLASPGGDRPGPDNGADPVRASIAAAGQEPADQEPERRPPQPGTAPDRPAAAGDQPAGQAAIAAAPTALLEGFARTAAGDPLGEVTVIAHCRELSRKAEPFEVRAVTDAAGRFSITVPIPSPDGLHWHLRAQRDDWIGAVIPEVVHLRPRDIRAGLEARLRRWAEDVEGSWRAPFVVTDAAGRPLDRVIVRVLRRQRDADGRERLTQEAGGRSGADGRIELQGDHLGEKLVLAIPWGRPFARRELPLAIREATPDRIAIALEADVPLRVAAVDARSAAPLAGEVITASRGGESLAVGTTDAAGRAELRGLDGGPVTLSGGALPRSPFEVEGVLPAEGPVTLRIKRFDDPTSSGLHGQEVHGRLVDARTGEPVVAEFGSVRAHWLAPGSPETRAEVLRRCMTPAPVQTLDLHEPPPPSAGFHLTGLAPGRWVLVAEVEGWALAATEPFELAAGQLIAGITIALEPGTRLEVEVRDALGRPLEGAWVWLGAGGSDAERAARAEDLARAAAAEQHDPPGRGRRTDAAGRAVFERVPSGIEFAVHAAHRSGRHGGSPGLVLAPGGTDRTVRVVVNAGHR